MVMKPDLYLASVSDIHLGHPKTPTLHITTNLGRAFPDRESTHKLDLILLGGDLFDRLLSLNQVDVPQILEWAGHFIQMCAREKIHAVFLEGTPGHDWGQAKILEVLKSLGMGQQYFHYVSELKILTIDELGVDILLVPDEWRPEPDDTWREVRELLRERQLEQVDFTVVHGAFDFQLPEHVKVPKHQSGRYESITRHRVYGAHIHTPSVRGKIRVNGSFDRLAHNEEEEKGHWRLQFYPDKPPVDTFIVNEHAMVYKTIDCTGLEIDVALDRLTLEVGRVPPGSHMRIKASKGDPILAGFDTLRKRHPDIHWSSKAVEVDVIQPNLLVDLRASFTQVQITPENIRELMERKLLELTSDPVLLQRCTARMHEILPP